MGILDPMDLYLLECLNRNRGRVISTIIEVDYRSPMKRSVSNALIGRLEGTLVSLIKELGVNNAQRANQILNNFKRRVIRERFEELSFIHGENFVSWQLRNPNIRVPGKYRKGEWSFDLLNKTWINKKEEKKTCNGL